MKRIIFVLMYLLICFSSFAQLEAGNFKVTPEGRVNWQKVYENTNVSFDDLLNTVNANTNFSDIQVKENKINFLGSGIKTDPSALGFSRLSTAFYALGDIKAFFTIDYKEGRYRVTAVNINCLVPEGNLGTGQITYKYDPIEESVGNGKGLKKGFIKKESVIMNHAIEKQLKIVKETDDNW